jgi:prepilin-type N-terminal cleavage/methylation domain-containing protein
MARSLPSPAGSAPAGVAGYTLTELLVVLAIMGLAAGLAPPLLQTARQHALARAAVYRLVAELEAAHERAVDTQEVVRVGAPAVIFYPDGSARGGEFRFDGATISVGAFSGRVDVGF